MMERFKPWKYSEGVTSLQVSNREKKTFFFRFFFAHQPRTRQPNGTQAFVFSTE